MLHPAIAVAMGALAFQPPPPPSPAAANPPRPPDAPAPPASPAAPGKTAPLVPYPHPLITEVLFAVPTGEKGDASGDGSRDTSGDEFIELVNPHDTAIDLAGYELCGKSGPPDAKTFKQLRFTFPPVTLKPGEVAVVFNGHAQSWQGPVGDTARAPEAGHEKFAGARVFTMANQSARVGLVNRADYVLLTSPAGARLHCIKWGDSKPPRDIPLLEEVPAVTGHSIARRTATGKLEPHPPIEGRSFSPGKFPFTSPDPTPARAPAGKSAP
ncbi:MAG: lamin tail domain-containing protein [Phycisphaerales bacterium]